MAKWSQGAYKLKNPEKYIGKKEPKYRSSWEMSFFNFCDTNPNVLQWASESIHIPYRNPLTGKATIYVPDVFMLYVDKSGRQKAELIEIKPLKETILTEKSTMHDKMAIAVNMAKWESARVWSKRNGITFRVVTEKELFVK